MTIASQPSTQSAPELRFAPPEIELLLLCARTNPVAFLPRIGSIIGAGIDWAQLVRFALAHGVTPLVAHAFSLLPSGVVPEEMAEAFRDHSRDNLERSHGLTALLIELVGALHGQGVTAIPFKGPVLAQVAYGDLALRRAGDLDLLLRYQDVLALRGMLEQRGFREETELRFGIRLNAAEERAYRAYQCEFLYLRQEDGIIVEAHWAVAPPAMSVALDYDAMRGRATTVQLGEATLPSLATEDLLIVLCVHGCKHEWTQLRWIVDIAELLQRVPGLDLDLALARAAAHGTLRMLLIGLGLAKIVMTTPLQQSVAKAMAADPVAGSLVRETTARLFDPEFQPPSVFRLSRYRRRMRERATDRFRYVLRTMTTPTIDHIRLIRLPPALHALYYPAKVAHDYLVLPVWIAAKRALGLRRG